MQFFRKFLLNNLKARPLTCFLGLNLATLGATGLWFNEALQTKKRQVSPLSYWSTDLERPGIDQLLKEAYLGIKWAPSCLALRGPQVDLLCTPHLPEKREVKSLAEPADLLKDDPLNPMGCLHFPAGRGFAQSNPETSLFYSGGPTQSYVQLWGHCESVPDEDARHLYFRPNWAPQFGDSSNPEFELVRFTPHRVYLGFRFANHGFYASRHPSGWRVEDADAPGESK